jgi:hypothetical protein
LEHTTTAGLSNIARPRAGKAGKRETRIWRANAGTLAALTQNTPIVFCSDTKNQRRSAVTTTASIAATGNAIETWPARAAVHPGGRARWRAR